MDRFIQELLSLLPLLLLGGVMYFAGLSLFTLWLISHPPRRTYSWAVSRGIPGDPGELDSPREFEEQTVTVQGCPITLWRIPGDRKKGPTIFLCPGWSDSKVGSVHRLPALLPHCSELIAIDSPGLGESPGWCTMGAREPKILCALVQEMAAGSEVVLAGWSLGGGAAIAAGASLASDSEHTTEETVSVVAVIAEAPYCEAMTPASRVMSLQKLPWRVNLPVALWVLGLFSGVGPRWKGFDRAQLAKKLGCPLLILHGSDDPISPVEDARDIAEAAPDSTLVITEGGVHNDLWLDPEFRTRQEEAVDAFLSRVLG